MGSDARVALYAPSKLAPFVSLPTERGGSTGYYSGQTVNGTSTWVETAISGYTPARISRLTTYGPQPTTPVLINADLEPATATISAAVSYTPASPFNTQTSSSSRQPSSTTSRSSIPPASTISSTSQAAPTTAPAAPATSQVAAATDASALTTVTKIGIGVGLAGGACLIAALIITIILLRKRNSKIEQRPAHAQPNFGYPGQPYPGQAPPYFTEAEKAAWHTGYPVASPYYEHSHASLQHSVPASYKPIPPPPIPMELAADHGSTGLHSEASGPHTPSPAYADVNRMDR